MKSKYFFGILMLLTIAVLSCKEETPTPVDNSRASRETDTLLTLSIDTLLNSWSKTAPLFENYPTTPYPNYAEMFVGKWTHGGTFYKHRHLLQLDLSTIPQNAIIDSAFVTFYPTNNAASVNVSAGQLNNYGDNAMYLEPVTSAWDKNLVCWNNQPASTSANRVAIANIGNGNDGTGKISIKELVQSWVDSSSTNYGMVLKFQDESTTSLRRVIFGSNNHIESSRRPRLQIYYRQ